jgi:Zn-dependent peptidase ImmA (M78 family)/transcriptional regulator with XRE-family HTH domain
MPKVNPSVLKWARETAGLSLSEAAEKIALRAARGIEPEERLAALEEGEASPTRALLVRMAKQYRRPLVTFYLGRPPRIADRGEDFRTTLTPGASEEEPLLDALMRDVLARQSLIRAALEAEDDFEPLSFVGAWKTGQGSERLASEMEQVLGFDHGLYRAAQTYDDAFSLLRGWAESAGVFVLLIGDLGSHHTAISVDTFRGYALADRVAPFIVINDRDARAAWSFTLLHEFCHLMLGYSGISDVYGSTPVEQFCNDVASRLLVSDHELLEVARSVGTADADRAQLISNLARKAKVSRTLVAYRFYKLDTFDFLEFSRLRDGFYADWKSQRESRRQRARQQEGGPNYYVVRRHRIGGGLLSTVGYLVRSGALTTSKAGQVLGVKARNVSQLLGDTAASIG